MRIKAIVPVLALAMAFIAVPGGVASAQTNKPKTENEKKPTVVEVQSGDTLDKIAQGHATTYVRLFNANEQIADPDVIHPGDKVRIPTADEQLADRPIPSDAPAPAPAPRPAVTAAPAAVRTVAAPRASAYTVDSSNLGIWDRLAQCESSGNWAINTGNGYYGGLQFTLSSWAAVGGSGLPSNASREEQIARGQKLQAMQGWGAWPACAAKLGLR